MATITPNFNYSPLEAAKKLNKAMKGAGTDEEAIIDVLTTHSASQREEIAEVYEKNFGNLANELKKEVKGKLRSAFLDMLAKQPTFLARELRAAMKQGPGTDEADLIEILCASKNSELHHIKAAYEKEFSRDLAKDVASETSGDFKALLVAQCKAERDEGEGVSGEQVDEDAKQLLQAGVKKTGTNEAVFNKILTERSYQHLREVFKKYHELSGHEIEVAIKKETSGDLQTSYLTIVAYIRDSSAYFAAKLHKAMKGAGTDDDTLVRILVSRSEIDLAHIAAKFSALYGGKLSDFIRKEAKGDYQNLLISIVRGL
jgi:hypothetical protein